MAVAAYGNERKVPVMGERTLYDMNSYIQLKKYILSVKLKICLGAKVQKSTSLKFSPTGVIVQEFM